MIYYNNSLDKFISLSDKKIICFGKNGYLDELFNRLDLYDRVDFFVTDKTNIKNKNITVGEWQYQLKPLTVLLLCSPETHIILITDDDIASIIRFLKNEKLLQPEWEVFHKFFHSEKDDFFSKYRFHSDCYERMRSLLNDGRIDYSQYGVSNRAEFVSQFKETLKNRKKLFIPSILFDITTFCTLNCKDCIALTPHYNLHKCNHHYQLSELLRDIKLFLDNVDFVSNFELIGGETFLYPELEKVLDYIIDCEKIGQISIMTNVTFLPNRSLLKRLKNKKIVLSVSVYKEEKNTRLILDTFRKHKINFRCRSFIGAHDWIPGSDNSIIKWASMRDISFRNGLTKEQAIDEYLYCGGRACRTILNGKLYACQVSARMHDLGNINSDTDYIDLNSEPDLKNKIRRIYEQDGCYACYHCHMADLNCKSIPGGEQ